MHWNFLYCKYVIFEIAFSLLFSRFLRVFVFSFVPSFRVLVHWEKVYNSAKFCASGNLNFMSFFIVKDNFFCSFAFSPSYNSEISRCTCKPKFQDSFSRFLCMLETWLWKMQLRPSWFLSAAHDYMYEQDLTCKISLWLINNTFTFCVEEYHYHLYCVQCTDVVSQSVNVVNVVLIKGKREEWKLNEQKENDGSQENNKR